MTRAASVVHKAAPGALITFSGLDYDVTLAPIVKGESLTGTANTSTAGLSAIFNPSDFPFEHKIVLELHKYDFEHTKATCESFAKSLYDAGYSTLNTTDPSVKVHLPMLLTEWGFIQDGSYWNTTTYNKCLIEVFGKWKSSGWMQWETAGSFYIKSSWQTGTSVQDLDEAWGLLNHNWTATRSPITVQESLEKIIAATTKNSKHRK
jgi:endoglucanase